MPGSGCHYIGLLSSAGCDLGEGVVFFTHIVMGVNIEQLISTKASRVVFVKLE